MVPDGGDAVGNDDAGQAVIVIERVVPDADDRQALIVPGMPMSPPVPLYPLMMIAPLLVV